LASDFSQVSGSLVSALEHATSTAAAQAAALLAAAVQELLLASLAASRAARSPAAPRRPSEVTRAVTASDVA